MALDSNGYPHISYYNVPPNEAFFKGDLKYAKWTGTAWSITTVDSAGAGRCSSIALDSNDNPHISYRDSTNLKYAKLMPEAPTSMPTVPPTPPRNLQATAGDNYVDLSWDPPSDVGGSPITGYNIYRGTAYGKERFVKAVGNVLTYIDNDVTNNQRYYYQLSAVNSAGEGAMSNEVSAKPVTSSEVHVVIERTMPNEVSAKPAPTTTLKTTPNSLPIIIAVTIVLVFGIFISIRLKNRIHRQKIEKYHAKMREWEKEGYDVSEVKEVLRNEK